MKKENEILNLLKYKYEFDEARRLSKKDLGEVYLVQGRNQKYIVKIHKNMVNYKRETEALRLLNKKFSKAPIMIDCGINGKQCREGYFIQEFWSGSTLLSVYDDYDTEKKLRLLQEAGELLGSMNTLFTEKELEESCLWKYAYEGVRDFSNYRWINLYKENIEQWLEVIHNRECGKIKFFIESAEIIRTALNAVDSNGTMGLLHRDFGFRNIMIEKNHVKGIIDFEYATLGDIVFDLSKLIFNDLDFIKDISLRNAFFAGWEKTVGQSVDWNRLWLYLAIQGLGAVQWVDRQKDTKVRVENARYREKGIFILKEACEKLQKI